MKPTVQSLLKVDARDANAPPELLTIAILSTGTYLAVVARSPDSEMSFSCDTLRQAHEIAAQLAERFRVLYERSHRPRLVGVESER